MSLKIIWTNRTLSRGEPLPEKNKDHTLSGNWSGYRECHIQPDWLLVYCIENDILILTLSRTGTHSDLFGKKFNFPAAPKSPGKLPNFFLKSHLHTQ